MERFGEEVAKKRTGEEAIVKQSGGEVAKSAKACPFRNAVCISMTF
ncbi:MAG: hypothetical protein AB1414_19145 [bacterium]